MTEQRTFSVDLRGVVDLLSHHLYGSPRVFVRELLQNAVDAITARRADDPDAPGTIAFETGPLAEADAGKAAAGKTGAGTAAAMALRVHDSGIGLTEPQVHELLATIGRSSKRDDIGFARHEFLGQFGIGMLSCFVVADEIRVVTRAAGGPTVVWTGYADGRYEVGLPSEQRAEIGTTVTLVPRRGSEHWTAPATVTDLARTYEELLPVPVTVDGVPVTAEALPWHASRADLNLYARRRLGFAPFDTIPLSVPEAGLTGVGFVLPGPVNPAAAAGHRVYLKRMLLTENATGLLPEWAFFVRCVVDASELRPTASREALYEDGLLESVRAALGEQIRGWLVGLSTTDPAHLADFLRVHRLGVKAMALHDDEMLRLVEAWMPVETNHGEMTLADFRERYGVLRYTTSIDQFKQFAPIAAAHGLALVNAAYTWDAELIGRLSALDPDVDAEVFEPGTLATRFDLLDPDTEWQLRPFLTAAQKVMDRLGCEIVLRGFAPDNLAALYLVDREAAFRGRLRDTKDKADAVWGDVLAAMDSAPATVRPQLVLNHRNPLVRRISALPDAELVELAVEALYGQALLLGYHPIRPADAALLNRSFLGLLDRAVPGEAL